MEGLYEYIQDYLSNLAGTKHPGLVKEKEEINESGSFYEFSLNGLKFGCSIQNLSAVKLAFHFYKEFCAEEISFWKPKYNFRVLVTESEQKRAVTMHKLNSIVDELPIKVLMWRYIDSYIKFKNDFKFVTKMSYLDESRKLEKEIFQIRGLKNYENK